MFADSTPTLRLPFTATSPEISSTSPDDDRTPNMSATEVRHLKEAGGRKAHEEGKLGQPSLNIITNFSKPNTTKVLEAAGSLAPESRIRQDSIQHRRKRSREQQGKGPIDGLKSENRVSELSPSDRDLMIGISMSSVGGGHQKQGIIVERDPDNEPKSANPEIIITPAGIQGPWLSPPTNKSRRRATSSVYSRSTHIPGINKASASPKPAVPPLPQPMQLSATSYNYSESRVTSWAESDDETQHEPLSRPESRESHTAIVRRNSVDTIATKYRSHGWWDKILTPFLDRSNTQKSNHFATPKIPARFENSREVDLANDAHKKRETGRTSVWFDKSRDTLAFFRDNDSDKDPSSPPPLPSATVVSPEYEEHKGLGEASEYYEASWHDFNSLEPFFKCENHTCSYGSRNYQRWKMVTSPVEGDPVTEGNLRSIDIPGTEGPQLTHIALNTAHGADHPTGERAVPGTRISSAQLKRDTQSHKGHESASFTDIDDESIASADHNATKGPVGIEAISPDQAKRASAIATPPASSQARALLLDSPVHKNTTQSILESPQKVASNHGIHVSQSAQDDSPRLPTPPLPPPPQPPAPASNRASVVAPVPIALPPPQLSQPLVRSIPTPQPASTSREMPLEPIQTSGKGLSTDASSPGALTPGLQRDIASHNAMPMEQARAVPHPVGVFGGQSTPDLPRSAHQPINTTSDRGLASEPSIHHTASNEALGSHPSMMFGASYPGPSRGNPDFDAAHHPVTVNQYFATSEQERPQERARGESDAYFENHPAVSNHQQMRPRSLNEKEEAKPKGPSMLSRLLGLLKFKKSESTKTTEQKKRRRLFLIIFGVLIAMVILIIILVTTLTMKTSDEPVGNSWLNLTNYPPIPTGISTIRKTEVSSESGCATPKTMWSCALPKEEQSDILPNKPDQLNFRLEIRFQNGTNLTNSSDFSKRSYDNGNGLTATQYIQGRVLNARAAFSNSLFDPSPDPPSEEDQDFLGNSTDGNQAPFGGEVTPFYITFSSPDQDKNTKRSITKRQAKSSNGDDDSGTNFPNVTQNIPPPSTNADGTASSATLLPFPSSQPLKLYNRGRSDEHYGFYTYFDKSIFLKSVSLSNSSSEGEIPADRDGGAEEEAANVRCTWPQTRFLVQIWTNAGDAAPLLNATNSTSSNDNDSSSKNNSTGSDLSQPGSFPYPVTITLDRHGGDFEKKNVYCYGLDDRQHIVDDEKQFQLEERAFGGRAVNPASGLFSKLNVTKEEGGPGGVDGGSGGCFCQWKNFASR